MLPHLEVNDWVPTEVPPDTLRVFDMPDLLRAFPCMEVSRYTKQPTPAEMYTGERRALSHQGAQGASPGSSVSHPQAARREPREACGQRIQPRSPVTRTAFAHASAQAPSDESRHGITPHARGWNLACGWQTRKNEDVPPLQARRGLRGQERSLSPRSQGRHRSYGFYVRGRVSILSRDRNRRVCVFICVCV